MSWFLLIFSLFLLLYSRRGITKIDHIKELMAIPQVQKQLGPDVTVESLYKQFLEIQAETIGLDELTRVIPGVPEAIAKLRERGIKVGSTTGYSRFMIPQLLAKAAVQGYVPDAIVCADEVPAGRPAPFMALEALKQMCISPVWACVKVGDTLADIGEGLNAGMWTVGYTTQVIHCQLYAPFVYWVLYLLALMTTR